MQQEKPIGAYSSAVTPLGLKPYGSYPSGSYPTGSYPTGSYPSSSYPTGSYPTVSYSYQHCHPLYSAPVPHSTRPAHPNLTTPSDTSNDSSEDGQPLPSPAMVLFRPVDFDNPSGDQAANCFPSPPCESTGGITVLLTEKKLWEKFNAVGNEMIVTKPGRRLFPSAVLNVRGLNPRTDYNISLRARPTDKYRYRYGNGNTQEWTRGNESEVLQNKKRQVFLHPNSPSSGELWMRKPVCFKTLKITHSSTSENGNILLYTMHKYQLELEVVPVGSIETPFKMTIPETTFIAVTSYQNQELTQLKIEHNPFAKGFRDKDVSPSPPPPTSYNRPILPLWQMPLPCPPLPSMQPAESHAGPETEGANTSSPDFAPESCSPAQLMASHYPQHPMLSYPLPYPCMPWMYGLPPPQDPIESSYDVEDED